MIDRRWLLGGIAAVVIIALALWSSGGDEEGPEAQIRAALDRAVAAVEARDQGVIMEIVSENFRSGELDRRRVSQLLFLQLRQTEWRRVFLSDTAIELRGDTLARVTTAAVLAGGDAETIEQVAPTRASVYRFDFDFVLEDGDWRITTAQYRRAGLEELLTPR